MKTPIAFVTAVRERLKSKFADEDNGPWHLRGDERSIEAPFRPAMEMLKGTGFRAQLWIGRQDDGFMRCTFELAGNKNEAKERKKIAESIRDDFRKTGFPPDVKLSKGSTIVRLKLSVYADTPVADVDYRDEVEQVISFVDFVSTVVLKSVTEKNYEKSPGLPSLVEAARWYRHGGGESPKHYDLKHYVATHPELVDLPTETPVGETEVQLLSGDRLDASFEDANLWVAVEVKSSESPPEDITRGVFQCHKYLAIMKLMMIAKGRQPNAQIWLVLEGQLLPLHSKLLAMLTEQLNVDVKVREGVKVQPCTV